MTSSLRCFVAGEAETQLRFLEYLNASLARKLDGLSEDDARRQLVPSGSCLLWLVKHVARAEMLWLEHFLTNEVAADASPDDELVDETIGSVTSLLEVTGRRVRAIVEGRGLDEVVEVAHRGQVSLRWILAHLVEEVARHAGHADILRELIDGTTGRQRWAMRYRSRPVGRTLFEPCIWPPTKHSSDEADSEAHLIALS